MSCSTLGCHSISTTVLLRPAATPVTLRGSERLIVIVTLRLRPVVPTESNARAPIRYAPSSTVAGSTAPPPVSVRGPRFHVNVHGPVPVPDAWPCVPPSFDHFTPAG